MDAVPHPDTPDLPAAGPAADPAGPAADAHPTVPRGGTPDPTLAAGQVTAARLDEALLGGERSLSLDELAAVTELTPSDVEAYWSWLGLPVTDPSEKAFTRDDADALVDVARFVADEELDLRAQTTLVRSMGHTTERLALWQVEGLVEHMARRFGLDDTSARLLVLDRLPALAPALERQLLHAWRRQLAAVAGRFATEFSGARITPGDDGGRLPLPRAVGFADIVSFTKRTAGLGSVELAEFVQTFETEARDRITAAGGRVVKTIGDAVLFVADDVATGAEVALRLAVSGGADGGPDEAGVPPVRVSLVWGRVLSRFGDVFGTSVNLAARLTDIAEPSTVLIDRDTAAALRGDPRFALTAQPEREVQGLGVIEPVRLQRAYAG
ncbi:adenylate cyclase [Sediminihabitans luteus]|nr:adenylate cyclase [Sediminihabitans luteus]